jgi:hypothetical protein
MLPKLAVRFTEHVGLQKPDVPGIQSPTISGALQTCWVAKLGGRLSFRTSVMALAGLQ